MNDSLERVVIFGGAGFIGRHLTDYFISEHEASEVVLADVAAPSWELPSNARFATCDVRQEIPESIGAAELVVNLAAVHRTPGHPDREYHETNESGARTINDFARRSGARRIWFTSSIAVYGPGESPKTETSSPEPVSAYGKSKLAAEAIHRGWAEESPDNRLTTARPGTVFGPGEGGNFTRLAAAMKRRAFVYPGRKDTRKACGYVRDLGPAFAHMERTAEPTALFNFAYPEPPTIEQVCAAISEAGRVPMPRITMPAGLVLAGGALLHRLGRESFDPARVRKLMESTNIVGAELAASGYEMHFDLSAAMRDWYAAEPAGTFV
jgi:nucleoside-diphosphate-sugar epimerase